jgi:hypothetical protein
MDTIEWGHGRAKVDTGSSRLASGSAWTAAPTALRSGAAALVAAEIQGERSEQSGIVAVVVPARGYTGNAQARMRFVVTRKRN